MANKSKKRTLTLNAEEANAFASFISDNQSATDFDLIWGLKSGLGVTITAIATRYDAILDTKDITDYSCW